MPQLDRRRNLFVPVEYESTERLDHPPLEDRVTLVLITDGKADILLNGAPVTLHAPCVMCLSRSDRIIVIENSLMSAQSFSLSPAFMKSRTTFRQLKGSGGEAGGEQDTLMLFYARDARYDGVLSLPGYVYLNVFEWMSVIGTEISAQSDGRWTCRIRRYLLSILNTLDELYEAGKSEISENTPVDTVLKYIHTH
ncbi:MAG: AraC family transcriptional regulator, partial [Clostridia bacterium]|nr:AraC family transcriptional regulator [Clostridia bacterium]